MVSNDLVLICASAFVAVFVLLGVLAAVMRLMLLVFPDRDEVTDTAVFAAVTTAMTTIYPGGRITRIEEIK